MEVRRRVTSWRLLGVTVAVALTSSCAAVTGHRADGASSRVSEHATSAGRVMEQGRGPLPARAVALRVTGSAADAGGTTTITALSARGTTWGGAVVLRVSESVDRGEASEVSAACFRYGFHYPRTSDDGAPHRVGCPTGRPLDLSRPRLPDGITTATERTVARVLAHTAANPPVTVATVRRDLTRALGADYTDDVSGDAQGSGTVGGFVRYGDQCLRAEVAAGSSSVTGPFAGDTCFGG